MCGDKSARKFTLGAKDIVPFAFGRIWRERGVAAGAWNEIEHKPVRCRYERFHRVIVYPARRRLKGRGFGGYNTNMSDASVGDVSGAGDVSFTPPMAV